MSREFKIGDKVYYPKGSRSVLTVYEDGLPSYPIHLQGHTEDFTRDGKPLEGDMTPSIFHATEENHALLEKLYGVEFEKPPTPPSSRDIIKAMLERGDKYVPCYVSSGIEVPNGGSYLDFIVFVHNDGRFYNQLGGGWKYATPFDPKTGERITEMPND